MSPEAYERKKARERARYAANPSRFIEYQQRLRAENPEREAERQRASYAKHRESRRAQQRAYRSANKTKVMQGVKEWQAANADKVRAIKRAAQARRRARLASAEGEFSVADIGRLLEMQRWRCAGCACSIRDGYHVDHIVALSRGGSNWPTNLQALCQPCNSSKHAKDSIDWAQENGRLL